MMKKPKQTSLTEWLLTCERLVAENTTPPRTRGKYKGHGSTDALAWTKTALELMQAEIRRLNRGIGYDENMALAKLAGLVFSAWYANVHRAKTLDPNRPLRLRRNARKVRERWVATLVTALNDDKLMADVWGHQEFNVPYGKKARGGKFV